MNNQLSIYVLIKSCKKQIDSHKKLKKMKK